MEEKSDYIDLQNVEFDNAAISFVEKDIALKYCILPFKIKNNNIYVAMSDILDISAKDYLSFVTKKEIIPFKASKEQINYYIELCYRNNVIQKSISHYSKEKSIERMSDSEVKSIGNVSAVEIIDSIIKGAIISNASDIHIEPFKKKIDIKLRIDGVLYKSNQYDISLYSLICTRIKIMALMNITEKKLPQDGSFNFEYNSKTYNMRVSTIPVIHGEKIVIRILYDSTKIIEINDLSESKNSCSEIKKILNYESGIVLITGPTGSGKTTTLYSLLNKLKEHNKNIITLENPVEHEMYGINQVNINSNFGPTFTSCLKNILRQDPDVISIGEIRDEETAQMAVRAAISGHLVFSTLHTRDSSEAILRLMNMKIPWYILHDCLCTVISQRLVKTVCPFCREKYELSFSDKEILKADGINKDITVFKGKGCTKCRGTGYYGRTAIFEILHLNIYNRRIINEEYLSERMRNYMKQNGIENLKQSCLKVLMDGRTSIDEYKKIRFAI